ncbi:MAG: hypothetical protein QOF18_2305 [Frankiaceae bacterium]|nr:hypothetical protein [Frankiaceae bacterium]
MVGVTSAGDPLPVRVVFVTGPPESATARTAELAGLDGWTGRDVPTALVPTAAGWLAGYDMGGGAEGLSAMVDEQTFLAALRVVTDAPYRHVADAAGARVVVDTVPDDAVSLATVRRLYPDATVLSPDDAAPPADTGSVLRTVPPRDSTTGRHLVVVVGSGRSGTTWLHRLLTAHPAVTGTDDGETWMFNGVGRFWQAHQRDGAAGLGAWLPADALLTALRACCDALLEAGRHNLRPDATHFVEKTPAHVWQLPLLARLYPDAAYVHLLRDGRDVALSLSRVEGSERGPGPAAAAWAAAVRAVRAAAPALTRFTEVRYERLLAAPVDEAGRVIRWLGLEDDAAFRAEASVRAGARVSPLPSTGQVGAGKWRDLDPTSLAEVDAAAGDLLAELGYA